MAEENHVIQLMCELGPYDEKIELIQQSEDDFWAVVYEDQNVVEIQYNEPDTKLILSFLLGNMEDVPLPAAEDEAPDYATFYQMLLTYNFLWQESGGIRMALDGPDRNVVMLLDICGVDLEVGTLAGILQQFLETAKAWEESLFSGEGPVQPGRGTEDSTPAMRV